MRGGERDVDVTRLADGLAAVERLGHSELACALLDQAREPEEILRALRRRERRPAVLEGVACGVDREADVLLSSQCDLEELLLGRRRDGWEPLVRPRLDLHPADEEPIALTDLHDVTRLGRGRVLPLEGRRDAGRALLDLRHQSMVK